MDQHPEELLLIHVHDNFLEPDFNFNDVSCFCLAQDSRTHFVFSSFLSEALQNLHTNAPGQWAHLWDGDKY